MRNDRYIVYFLSRTKEAMNAYIEMQLKEAGIDNLIPSHGNILTSLYESEGPLQLGEIAKRIGKDKSTVTPLAKKLESLGYIKRTQDEKDRRKTYISLTEKGEDLKKEFDSISAAVKETAYNGFTEEEKEIFLVLLKRMYMNFREG